MFVEIVEGKKRAVGVDKTIFTVHYHEDDDKPKALARREISHDLILIQKNPLSDEAKAADARHKLWLSRALSSSDDFLKMLNKRGDVKTYTERHPPPRQVASKSVTLFVRTWPHTPSAT